jgi:antitoxin MazE
MAAKPLRMQLKVSRWGNSLAVRLPAEASEQIGVAEGDTLVGEVGTDGRLVLAPQGRPVSEGDLRRMRRFLSTQKQTEPVVAAMRRESRY